MQVILNLRNEIYQIFVAVSKGFFISNYPSGELINWKSYSICIEGLEGFS